MVSRLRPDPLAYAPAALRREPAARFLGISANYLKRLVRQGVMPAPRILGDVEVFLTSDLILALESLPRSGEAEVLDADSPNVPYGGRSMAAMEDDGGWGE